MGKDEKLQEYEYSEVPTKIFEKKPEIPTRFGYGVRHIQLLIFFLCVTVDFISRGHLGVTVVSMTSPLPHLAFVNPNLTGKTNYMNTENVVEQNMTVEEIYADFKGNTRNNSNEAILLNSTENHHTTFDWSKSTQEMVLGSFFLGYCLMTIPMGLVVQRWGGKIPMQISLSVNGVVSILTPWLVNWGGWKAVCACRIAQGLSQAGVYPCLQDLLAKWVPVSERGTLASYVYRGSTTGTILAFQLSGHLCESRWGWPSTFWAVGLINLSLFAILTIFGAALPSDHKTISEKEKSYILGRDNGGNTKRLKTPWKAILCSKPVWGVLATHVGSGITFVFFFTQVPSYIHYILSHDLRSSGFLSSLPYLVSFFTSMFFGYLSDFLTNKNIIEVKTARKMFNSISHIGVAGALLCVSFTSSTVVAVVCLVFTMGSYMAVHVGWMVNHIDLAPNFGGTLMMIGNTIMNLCSVLLPVLVSYVVTDVYNQTQWRTMFLIMAGVSISTNVLFVILMSADLQPWNDGYQKDKCVEAKLKDEEDMETNQQ